MRCLNTNELVTRKVSTIYEKKNILQLRDLKAYNLAVSKFMYKYTNSQIPLPPAFNNPHELFQTHYRCSSI